MSSLGMLQKISCNPIGTERAIAVAKLLHSNKSLEEVYVSYCSIDSVGVCHLVQPLCDNTTLKELDMRMNIGESAKEGIHKLFEGKVSSRVFL